LEIYNLVSFFGIFILIGVAWLFSNNKKSMNWQLIGWGIGLQLVIGFLIFVIIAKMPSEYNPFLILNDIVNTVLASSMKGAEFVFGRLALAPGTTNASGEQSMGFYFAFQAMPTVIFFSALMSILYFFNVMPWVIKKFASLFTRVLKISGAESLAAASNIFVGVESALSIKPHLPTMTRSELCTILTAGMATVSSNVLALYILALRTEFPSIAAHLLSASLLSAPAAIVLSKVVFPESERPQTLGHNIAPHYEKESNLFQAIINGSMAGVKLIVGIIALLISILALAALVDLILGSAGGFLNRSLGIELNWSLAGLAGYVMYPFALILGIPPADAGEVSQILGMRIIETEVPGYFRLAAAMTNNVITHPRSLIITSYALCGFAHVGSLAIFIGGISALVPSKQKELTQVGLRALLAATLATFMTACVAGTFYMNSSLLL